MNETPPSDPVSRLHVGRACQVAGAAALLSSLALAVWASHELPSGPDWPSPQRITCVNNLKQLGLIFRTWAIDHDGSFPFNRSTNDGGSRELCARGADGFDTNAVFHFQIMSNELTTPLLLICPKDRSKKPARDFQHLQAANVTYDMRSGTNIDEAHPREVFLRCPLHGNLLHCDGSVVEVTADEQRTRPAILDLLHYNARSRFRAGTALVAVLLGCALVIYGGLLRSEHPSQ